MRNEQRHVAKKSAAQVGADLIERREQFLDDALRGTFPASDPPAAIASQGCKD
jgi:hypothetical protein